jgi:hypothetical protein
MKRQAIFVGAPLLLSTGIALAAEPAAGRVEFSSHNQVAHDIASLDDSDPGDRLYTHNELAWGVLTDNWLRYIQPLGGGDSYRLGVQARGKDYADVSGLSSRQLAGSAEYWNTLDGERRWQLRLGVDATLNWREGDELYRALRGDAALYRLFGTGNQAWLRTRLDSYDYSESQLAGFDQNRALVAAGYRWRGAAGLREEYGIEAFGETSHADTARYGYDRYGLQVNGVWPTPAKTLDMIAEGSYWHKRFDAPFSALGAARSDQRLVVQGGLRWSLTQNFRVEGTVGWVHNASNVGQFDADGAGVWLSFDYRTNGFF